MNLRLCPLLLLGFGLCAVNSVSGADAEALTKWPEAADPVKLGKRLAENFVGRKFRAQTDPKKASSGIIYPEACA